MHAQITFRQATHADALFIAQGFHTAMLMSDTPESRIRLFAEKICMRDDVLYSAPNTTIVEVDGKPAGMITAYDGSRYSDMRRVTMALVKEHMGIDLSDMEDESETGEYYLDSLAVLPEYRGRGLGRMLLRHQIDEGQRRGLNVTLAVDPVNTNAQRLYRDLGFVDMRDIYIFGHTYWKWVIPARK